MTWQHCVEIIDGEECGQEQCAPVHMTADGHDFKEGEPENRQWPPSTMETKISKAETFIDGRWVDTTALVNSPSAQQAEPYSRIIKQAEIISYGPDLHGMGEIISVEKETE